MTGKLSFLPGTLLSHAGRGCLVIDIVDLSNVMVRYNDNGRSASVSVAELRKDAATRASTPNGASARVRQDLLSVTPQQWDKAQQKFEIIRPLVAAGARRRTEEEVNAAAAKAGKDPATIYRWLATYEETGVMSSLLRRSRSDRGGVRLSDVHEKIIAEVIEVEYKSEQRKAPTDTAEAVATACKAAKIKPPHLSTIRRRIEAISEEERVRRRQGRKAARERFEPHKGSFPGADFPLSVVQLDHSPVDLIFVDEEYRRPINRGTLTLAIDVNTRMVPGFSLSLEAPSFRSAGACLANAILPKETFLAKLGVKGDWPCWGLMRKVHSDNAAEFVGTSMEYACKEWNIGLEQRPKGAPNYGGHIERLFRTFMKRVHTLPGTTFSSTADRLEYDSDGRAIMTPREFEKWFTIFIVKFYHQKAHKGICDIPPIKAWEEGILGNNDKKGIGLPERVVDERKLRLDFLPHKMRTVQEYGIDLEGYKFIADVLRPWIHALDPEDRKHKRKFVVKYDPFDLSEVYFLDPELRTYFTIPRRDASKPPVSIWEIKKAKAHQRKKGYSMVNEELIDEGIAEMREIEKEAAKKTKAARRTQQRRAEWSVKSVKSTVSDAGPTTTAAEDDDDGPIKPYEGIVEPNLERIRGQD